MVIHATRSRVLRICERYDNYLPPAEVQQLSLLYIESLVLHSQLHPCLPSTGGIGKVVVTKVKERPI